VSAQTIGGAHNSHFTPTSPSQPLKQYTLCSTLSRVGRAIAVIFKAFIRLISCCRKKSITNLTPREHGKYRPSSIDAAAEKTHCSKRAKVADNIELSNLASEDESKDDGEDETKEAPPISLEAITRPLAESLTETSAVGNPTTAPLPLPQIRELRDLTRPLLVIKSNEFNNYGYLSPDTIHRLNTDLSNPALSFDPMHVTQIFNAFNQDKALQSTLIEEIPAILQPTSELMKRVSFHYKSKYNIDIFVSNSSDFQAFIESRGSNQEPYGVIVTDDNDIGHVVPILIINNGANKHAIKLDVLGVAENLPITKEILKALKESSFEIFSSMDPRQADTRSCRTEALTILRNILLYLRKLNISNFNHFSNRHERGEMSTKEAKLALIPIPGEVDYVDQVSRKDLEDIERLSTIRTEYSAKESKRARGESVLSFRNRYKREVKFIRTYKPAKLRLETPSYSKISNLDDRRTLSLAYDSGFTITEEERKQINIYQALKAYRYASKFTDEVTIPTLFQEFFEGAQSAAGCSTP
jgi:hypothetical protein